MFPAYLWAIRSADDRWCVNGGGTSNAVANQNLASQRYVLEMRHGQPPADLALDVRPNA